MITSLSKKRRRERKKRGKERKEKGEMGKKKEEKEVNRKKTDKDGFWFTQDKSKTFLLEIIIFFPQTGKI